MPPRLEIYVLERARVFDVSTPQDIPSCGALAGFVGVSGAPRFYGPFAILAEYGDPAVGAHYARLVSNGEGRFAFCNGAQQSFPAAGPSRKEMRECAQDISQLLARWPTDRALLVHERFLDPLRAALGKLKVPYHFGYEGDLFPKV